MVPGLNDITVVATSNIQCSEDIIITAGELEKTITLNVYDPESIDIGKGLLIKYVNEYENIVAALDTHGIHYWKPVLSKTGDADYNARYEGYRALGSLARGSIPGAGGGADWNDDLAGLKNIPMIVVKDTNDSEVLLEEPDSYTIIWQGINCANFGIPGCFQPAVIWNPVCPTGYGAMGSVSTSSSTQPPAGSATCVKNEFLIRAEFAGGRLIYTDAGSGNGRDLQVYNGGIASTNLSPETVPVPQTGKLPLWPGTMHACWSNGIACADPFYAYNLLAIPTPVIERIDQTQTTNPQLAGFSDYLPPGPLFTTEIRVPFTLVPEEDPNCGDTVNICTGAKARVAFNATQSPFYYLGRETQWQHIGESDNRGFPETTLTVTYEDTNVAIDTQSFTEETSTTVTYGGGVDFKGISASYEVVLNNKFIFTESSSSIFSSSQSIEYPLIVPADSYAELLAKKNTFYRRNDIEGKVGSSARAVSPTDFKPLVFPLQ